MSDEMTKKVGRGGAGNFYTKADVENASHVSLPPQKSSASSPPVDTRSDYPTYSRTGRGGVGNYKTPSQELPASSSDVKGDLLSAREAFDASRTVFKNKITGDKSVAYRGQSGRGGAGNWKQGNEEAEKRRVEDEEMKARFRIDESIRLDVEEGLKPPPKAYAAPENAFERSR